MSKRRVTLAGPQPERQEPLRIYRGQRRQHMVRKVIAGLRGWRLSPFEHEGSTRAGIRTALVLDGHAWQRADNEAASLIEEAFRLLGAVRPTWIEGQPQYAAGREYCWTCRGPLDKEDRANGRKFCCDDCYQLAQTHRRDLVAYADTLAYHAGYYAAWKNGLPESECDWCGKRYRMQHLKQRFCSRSCAQNVVWGDRKVKPKPCLHCGEIFTGRQVEDKFCSRECHTGYVKQHGSLARLPERHCDVCKAIFRPKSSNARFCSKACVTVHKVAYTKARREQQRKAAAFTCEEIEPVKKAA